MTKNPKILSIVLAGGEGTRLIPPFPSVVCIV